MTENPKDVEEYFENSKCKICGVVVQPHFQGNTKLPKDLVRFFNSNCIDIIRSIK
jgi:hypothetical protein